MTKKQKREVLYEAAEAIATHKYIYSCAAIEAAQIFNDAFSVSALRRSYADFYQQPVFYRWTGLPYTDDGVDPDSQSFRVLLLLMFAEAGL